MGWSGLLLPKLVMINMLLGHHDEILKLCGLLQDWADQPQCAHDGRHGLGRLCFVPTAATSPCCYYLTLTTSSSNTSRRKRLEELRKGVARQRFGGLEEIRGSEFVAQVTNAGEGIWVVCHLYKDRCGRAIRQRLRLRSQPCSCTGAVSAASLAECP